MALKGLEHVTIGKQTWLDQLRYQVVVHTKYQYTHYSSLPLGLEMRMDKSLEIKPLYQIKAFFLNKRSVVNL